MTTSYCNSSQHLVEHLAELGLMRFGAASFANGEYRLDLGKPWSTIHWLNAAPTSDPLSGQLGAPGLWKRLSDREMCRLVADLPTDVLRDDLDPDAWKEDLSPLTRLIKWVLHMSSGGSLGAWQPPELEEIESWYGPDKLTVVAGQYVRQGTLYHGPGRLAVRIPIVPVIPPELPEARMDWLRSVLIDAQDRHRAARIGLAGEPPQQSVVAEVDLSGAPAGALQTLFTASLAALKHAVEWSIQPAGFLVDLNVDCRALEVRPHPSA